MSKDDDNLESLEQELKALKKKKLQKEINKLEKDLNISSKTTVEKVSKALETPTQKEKVIDEALWIVFGVLFIATLLAIVFQNNINLDSITNWTSDTQESNIAINNEESSTSDDSREISNNLANVPGLKVDVSCQIMYKGRDESTPPILKVSVKVVNSTSKVAKSMSAFITPPTDNFRNYFEKDVVGINSYLMKSVYYNIYPLNKDKVHTVFFYISSHSPGKAVSTCSGQA